MVKKAKFSPRKQQVKKVQHKKCPHNKFKHACFDCSPHNFCPCGLYSSNCTKCRADLACQHGYKPRHCFMCRQTANQARTAPEAAFAAQLTTEQGLIGAAWREVEAQLAADAAEHERQAKQAREQYLVNEAARMLQAEETIQTMHTQLQEMKHAHKMRREPGDYVCREHLEQEAAALSDALFAL